jgi:hypothetical protein
MSMNLRRDKASNTFNVALLFIVSTDIEPTASHVSQARKEIFQPQPIPSMTDNPSGQ